MFDSNGKSALPIKARLREFCGIQIHEAMMRFILSPVAVGTISVYHGKVKQIQRRPTKT